MKRKIYSKVLIPIIGALMMITIGGCEKLDEGTKGAVTADTFYADALSLESGVTGIYGILQRSVWGVDILAAYTGADDLTTQDAGNKWVFREGDQFALTAGNARTITIWNGYYKAINAANAFIENAHPVGVAEATVNNALANAYFVRGLLYFRLATIFGDIPMPLNSVPDYTMEKTSQRDVIAQSIKDMEFVEKWAVNARDTDVSKVDGHATKTAAKAFIAKAYMQLTGYPFNETDKWEQVKTYTKQIIDAGVYSLMDDYIQNFGRTWDNNKETIWAHQFSKQSWPIGTECRWYGAFWQNWMDMYLEWNYYNGDPDGYRKNVSTSVTSTYSATYAHPVLTKLNYGTVAGKPEYEHTWQTSNDMPAMRYAEVLLMYAEACANTNEKSEAVDKLNLVKRRAYANNSTTSAQVAALGVGFWKNSDTAVDYKLTDFATTQELVDAIVLERKYEFTAEVGGNRWLDLVRLEKVGTANADRDAREIPLIGDPSNKALWYSPIPETEVNLNSNLGN